MVFIGKNKSNKRSYLEKGVEILSLIFRQARNKDSFTLIELLIVIATIGILAATVVIVLNPTQLLAQSRDSARIQDLADINTAIKQYLADNNTNLGSSNTVYVSVPDSNSSCSDLGLPALPTGWSYHCVSTSTLTSINGTGWIPLQFSSVTTGNPLPTLPIDPLNTTSTGEFYTYATNGTTYELTSYFESNKYQTYAALDGGVDPTTYEVGDNLILTPFLHGLVGSWDFDNPASGVGAITTDSSGWGFNGTLEDATSTGTGPFHKVSGCVQRYCYQFDGLDDYILTNNPKILTTTTNSSISVWVVGSGYSGGADALIAGKEGCNSSLVQEGNGQIGYEMTNPSCNSINLLYSPTYGQWYNLVLTYNTATNLASLYINGSLFGSKTITGGLANYSNNFYIGGGAPATTPLYYTNSIIDDVHTWNTLLTSSQVQAIYNSEKP